MSNQILFVDDEPHILKALTRLFMDDGYEIHTMDSPMAALDMLKQTGVDVVISDQRMPEMSGTAFLERVRQLHPDSVRMILTGYADYQAAKDAINNGNVYRLINKPWNDDELKLAVRDAFDRYAITFENKRLFELTHQQNRELERLNRSLEEKVKERTWALRYQNKMLSTVNDNLEKSLMDTIRLLLSLVDASNPQLGEYMRETAQMARCIAESAALSESEQNNIEMAGLVHDMGLLGLPGSLAQKDEKSMNPDEMGIYRQHPVTAALPLSAVERLKEVGRIVLSHHENVDGQGFPDGLAGKEIPVGSKVLAIAADYCTVIYRWPRSVKKLMVNARRHIGRDATAEMELSHGEVLRRQIAERVIIEGAGIRYDPALVRHFMETLGSNRLHRNMMRVPYRMLKKGMVLAGELRLKDGRLLLSRGMTLDDSALRTIRSIGSRDLFKGDITVFAGTQETAGKEVINQFQDGVAK